MSESIENHPPETQILSLEEIKAGLKDRKLYAVASQTGLSYPTLKKLSEGKDLNYTMDTLRAVSEYVRAN